MMPQAVASPVDGYVEALREVAGDQVSAVYAVGSLALDDFSSKQSNVDLVVVGDPRLDVSQRRWLRRAERSLQRAGRPAQVWHTNWEEIAGGPTAVEEPSPLATPMTWTILRSDPMPLQGPDWPVAWTNPEELRHWALERLRALAHGRQGLLVLRRDVGPFVLEAARLAHMAIAGRVLSKSEAGEAITGIVSSRHRRVVVDSVGYRQGAQTSMYWGPFERKYDALALARDLLHAADDASVAGAGEP
jgi:hypothetical protein